MKVLYGISRWNNDRRARTRHIDNGGKPLCNIARKVFSWESEEGEPTCDKCKAIYNRPKTGLWDTPMSVEPYPVRNEQELYDDFAKQDLAIELFGDEE